MHSKTQHCLQQQPSSPFLSLSLSPSPSPSLSPPSTSPLRVSKSQDHFDTRRNFSSFPPAAPSTPLEAPDPELTSISTTQELKIPCTHPQSTTKPSEDAYALVQA